MREKTIQLSIVERDSARVAAPVQRLAPGSVLDGRYLLQALLGEGGMGAVWRAEHVRIGRPVAVKVLHPEVSTNPREVERFRREAQIAVRLSSPHVVEVLDFGDAPDRGLYLVMELLDGESVRERLRREERLAPDVVAELMRQLMRGLDAAHRAGIVHRDLKPENLWLVPLPAGGERLKILDFGIAKLAQPPPGSEQTQAGLVMGTPQFLSPEQAVGGDVDGRADLYSAGIIAYLLLTGRHPFPTLDARSLLCAHAYEAVPSPAREVPELANHPALLRFVARATEKDRNLRAQTAAELLDVLDGRAPAPTPRGGALVAITPPPTAVPGFLRPPSSILPRGVHATFLVAEIAGWAALDAARARDELAEILTEHDRLVVPAVRAYHGRRVKVRGDALVATFRSPTNAVLCAMAIQDRLAARNRAGPRDRVEVRIAVHLGEARLEGGDLVGHPLEVAAAALRGAAPGEIRVTRAAYLALIRGEVRLEPLPPLEEGPEPMPLYRVERASGAAPYGGREAANVAASERLARALAPLTSIGDADVEGRGRAARRVTRAASALAGLLVVDGAARAGLRLLAVVRLAWNGRPGPLWLERATLRLGRLRESIRVRRPVHRATLLRPLS